MRHRKDNARLSRPAHQRDALLTGLVCSLISEKRIKTTLTRAKAARQMAEKMVTLGKKNTLAARRSALAQLHREPPVVELFEKVAPVFADRAGGYTRIVKLGKRLSDSSEMAILEWTDTIVDQAPVADEPEKKSDEKVK